MKVERRAAGDKIAVLKDEHATACLLRTNLELNQAKTARVYLSEAVFTCRDNRGRLGRGRGLWCRRERLREPRLDKNCRDSCNGGL
jgi:hypothetical protein